MKNSKTGNDFNLNHLAFFASQFGTKEIIDRCVAFGKTKDISKARDFHAFSLKGTGIIESALSELIKSNDNEFIEKVGFEYLEIVGPWNQEHHHIKSDGILLCIDVPEGWQGYFELEGRAEWFDLIQGQLIVIPKNVNHGFRVKDNKDTDTLKMIGINYPPIAHDDTIPVY